MSQRTSIEWTDQSWNPVRGCSKCSEGCRNCYAERMAARFSDDGFWGHGYATRTKRGPRWTGRVDLVESKLDDVLQWRKPRRIFVNSTSDLFHERLEDRDIDQVLVRMLLSSRHTFQVLTKRADRMRRYLRDPGLYDRMIRAATLIRAQYPDCITVGISSRFPVSWIWWGVSVEDQRAVDVRIEELLETPARVRFVSCEPLLRPVDLTSHLQGLDWVIVGGESGPAARPMKAQWATALRDQCKAARVAFFFKQFGGRADKGAKHLEGEIWRDFPTSEIGGG